MRLDSYADIYATFRGRAEALLDRQSEFAVTRFGSIPRARIFR